MHSHAVIRIAINSRATQPARCTRYVISLTVTNNAVYELPSTGGSGTCFLNLFGIMLTGLAGAGLVMKRRRKSAA